MADESACLPAAHEESGGALRRVMSSFVTGVAVVTAVEAGQPHGMTVNSLTSVSLDPALILVSLTKGARTAGALSAAGRFAVSVLSESQQPIAARFATRAADHFAGLTLEYGRHAVPVVPHAVAHLECRVFAEHAAGDHTIFLGQVVSTCDRPGVPLTFHGGRFARLAVDPGGSGAQPPGWSF